MESIYDDRREIKERIEEAKHGLQLLLFGERGVLKGELSGKKKILDLGCGKGAVGAALKELSPEVERIVGVDVKKYSSEALQLYAGVYLTGAVDFLRQAAKQDQKFDLIISWGLPPEVVVDSIKEIGQNQQRVLNPGGLAVLACEPILTKSEEEVIKTAGFSTEYPPVGTHIIIFLKT